MSLTRAQINQVVREVFRKYDKNNNQFLEKEEVYVMLKDSFERLRKNDKV
jgi:Ca2+-binding EF-hand superfamily protein